MTQKEISKIKVGDYIVEGKSNYRVTKIYRSGVLTEFTWENLFGKFSESKFFRYNELLDKDITLINEDYRGE